MERSKKNIIQPRTQNIPVEAEMLAAKCCCAARNWCARTERVRDGLSCKREASVAGKCVRAHDEARSPKAFGQPTEERTKERTNETDGRRNERTNSFHFLLFLFFFFFSVRSPPHKDQVPKDCLMDEVSGGLGFFFCLPSFYLRIRTKAQKTKSNG